MLHSKAFILIQNTVLQRKNNNMEESISEASSHLSQQLSHNLQWICSETAQKILKMKQKIKSSNFFFSSAHQFLQKLIHLHSKQVHTYLLSKAKMIEKQLQSDHFPTVSIDSQIWRDLILLKQKKQSKLKLFQAVNQLFRYLIFKECEKKLKAQVENIILEINCSLNYACPVCIKLSASQQPKTIKLIQHASEDYDKYPRPKTMKNISVEETVQKLPFIARTNKLDQIFQNMKAQRIEQKKQAQGKQKRINRVWHCLGHLMQLQRQKFVVDYIFTDVKNKEQTIYQQLKNKNSRNSDYLKQFHRKLKKHLQKQNESPQRQSLPKSQGNIDTSIQKLSSDIGDNSNLKLNKQTESKKSPMILSPICNIRQVKNVFREKKEKRKSINMHLTINFQTAKSRQLQFSKDQPIFTKRGQSRVHYNHRVLKSSRDVLEEKHCQKKQLFQGFDQNWSNSLKVI